MWPQIINLMCCRPLRNERNRPSCSLNSVHPPFPLQETLPLGFHWRLIKSGLFMAFPVGSSLSFWDLKQECHEETERQRLSQALIMVLICRNCSLQEHLSISICAFGACWLPSSICSKWWTPNLLQRVCLIPTHMICRTDLWNQAWAVLVHVHSSCQTAPALPLRHWRSQLNNK